MDSVANNPVGSDAAGRRSAPGVETEDRDDGLRQYLDLADAIFLEIDRSGRVEFVNPYGLELLGCSLQDLRGRDWFEACVPAEERVDARARFEGRIAETPQGEESSFEMSLVTRGGEVRRIKWSEVALQRRGDGVRLVASGLDVTAQREAEANLDITLRELRAYRYALDQSSILAITDARGRISFVNERFCEISKYPRDELIGRDHNILNSGYHPPDFFKKMWQTITSGEVWHGDIRNRAKDGSYYWVDTTIVPVVDEGSSQPREYIAVRNEITRRKDTEAALERSVAQLAEANLRLRQEHEKRLQAEKMASIGMLAAGVAHEINNPLSGVMACLEGLQTDSVRQERRAQYFSTARDGLERIQQTVRGLLDFARQRPLSPDLVDLGEVADACARLIAPLLRERQVEMKIDTEARSTRLTADRAQLMQALVNLLMNAAYVSPPRSAVTLLAEAELGGTAITVADEGPGMSREVMARACEPFFTTKPEGEGTGLGLAVTEGIAHAHGGRLSLSQRRPPDSGTLATLWLPKGRSDFVASRNPSRGR